MTHVADIFFLISDTLLGPVLLGLLFGLAAVLWLSGRTLREVFSRYKARKARRFLVNTLEKNCFDPLESFWKERPATTFFFAAERIFHARNDSALIEKILADIRRRDQEKIATMKLWLKFGPALGLMGTLIPLGPALVGLAAGDLESMARNLQIAFATTVVGLLISLIAYVLVSIHQRWATRDSILLTFAAERWEIKP